MFVYILKSKRTGRYYIGSTQNIEIRVQQHNLGLSSSTKPGIPWEIIYNEQCSNRSEAVRKEKLWKSYKSGNALKKLLGEVA